MTEEYPVSFLENGWLPVLEKWKAFPEIKTTFGILKKLLDGEEIYPRHPFRVFGLLPPEEVKVIILGQDPYHRKGLANGIAFSVNRDQKIPASLNNIFSEVKREYDETWQPAHGDLTNWVKQGVLLLNAVSTVEKGVPGSHRNLGWELFTHIVVDFVLELNPNVVGVAWGKDALKIMDKKKFKHLLISPHPSPYSAHTGFHGNNHFREVNKLLLEQSRKEIEWMNI